MFLLKPKIISKIIASRTFGSIVSAEIMRLNQKMTFRESALSSNNEFEKNQTQFQF